MNPEPIEQLLEQWERRYKTLQLLQFEAKLEGDAPAERRCSIKRGFTLNSITELKRAIKDAKQ